MTDFTIAPERAEHASAIEALHEEAFGPGRFARAAFRLREQGPHDPACSFVIADGVDAVLASVRMTPVLTLGSDHRGYLLGPLAVSASRKNCGMGRALVRQAIEAARQANAQFVVLVGDAPYYAPLGFVVSGTLRLPGPVVPRRVLVYPLANIDAAAPASVITFDAISDLRDTTSTR